MLVAWQQVRDYTDIIFEKAEGMGKITINRPEVRNAFRPETLTELIDAFNACLLYTSPSPRDRQKSRMPSSA